MCGNEKISLRISNIALFYTLHRDSHARHAVRLTVDAAGRSMRAPQAAHTHTVTAARSASVTIQAPKRLGQNPGGRWNVSLDPSERTIAAWARLVDAALRVYVC